MTITLHKFIIHNRTKMEKASKVWKYFHKSPQNKDKVTIGFISTLNYSFTIRTIRIVGTEYHYSVFVFGQFSKPEYIRYSVFGPFSKPEHIRYSVKIYYSAQH